MRAAVRVRFYLNEDFVIGRLSSYVRMSLCIDLKDTPADPHERMGEQPCMR